MKKYLVGGAVRDRLLNLTIMDRDWVVVGATPEEMRALGYQQVGRDFPVFIHPITGEEYALARCERKTAPGYHGFVCDFSPTVTLEQDLARRDLTINAMAMDESGLIIDPYGGQASLSARRLEHVSEAFVEDPVRVLRTARFLARFYHMDFRIADETRLLMYDMVCRGELAHLVAERVWQEWHHSLSEKNPEQFINALRSCAALKLIIPELDALFGIPAQASYHPEVDTGIHSLMVLAAACALSDDPAVRFAALVHDLGKAQTEISAWPKHKAHDERGGAVVQALCQRLKVPEAYRNLAVHSTRYHIQVHRLFELSAEAILSLLEGLDAFRRPWVFRALLMVCKADALGRIGASDAYPQQVCWERLLDVAQKVDVKAVLAEGYQGQEIKDVLRQRRLVQINEMIQHWNKNEKQ